MSRSHGVTADELLALGDYRDDARFTLEDRAVLDYADAMTRTPVEVDEPLFARLQAFLDDLQIVELTAAIAWENYRARFNHALEMEAEGFSEGAVCPIIPRRELTAAS